MIRVLVFPNKFPNKVTIVGTLQIEKQFNPRHIYISIIFISYKVVAWIVRRVALA